MGKVATDRPEGPLSNPRQPFSHQKPPSWSKTAPKWSYTRGWEKKCKSSRRDRGATRFRGLEIDWTRSPDQLFLDVDLNVSMELDA